MAIYGMRQYESTKMIFIKILHDIVPYKKTKAEYRIIYTVGNLFLKVISYSKKKKASLV